MSLEIAAPLAVPRWLSPAGCWNYRHNPQGDSLMPYVSPKHRDELQERYPKDVGELTYEITTVVVRYLERRPLSYAHIAEAIAALECAKLEFYRRVATPYEQEKCVINGDVYGSVA